MLERISEYFGALNPLFYEEIFFQINKTDYSSRQLISQNRLFVGFNWRESKDHYWEIGYINQYLLSTPVFSENAMNHILTITYNIL
jgi:hypothetical protein